MRKSLTASPNSSVLGGLSLKLKELTMFLSQADLDAINYIKKKLAESKTPGRWGWNVHAFKDNYAFDIKRLLRIIKNISEDSDL